MDGKLVGVDELAEVLDVPKSWVYKHVDQIPTVRVGRYVKFDPQAVLAYLKEHSVKPIHIKV